MAAANVSSVSFKTFGVETFAKLPDRRDLRPNVYGLGGRAATGVSPSQPITSRPLDPSNRCTSFHKRSVKLAAMNLYVSPIHNNGPAFAVDELQREDDPEIQREGGVKRPPYL